MTSSSDCLTGGGTRPFATSCLQYWLSWNGVNPRTVLANATRTGEVSERSTGWMELPSPHLTTLTRNTSANTCFLIVLPGTAGWMITLNGPAVAAGPGPRAEATRSRATADARVVERERGNLASSMSQTKTGYMVSARSSSNVL